MRAFYPVMSLLICFKYCLQGTKHMTGFTVCEIYGPALNQKYKYFFLGLHQRVDSSFPRSYMPIKIQTKEIMLLRGKYKKKVFPPWQVKICFLSKCVSREDHAWLLLASYILDTSKLFFDAPDPLFRTTHTTSNSIKFLIIFHV